MPRRKTATVRMLPAPRSSGPIIVTTPSAPARRRSSGRRSARRSPVRRRVSRGVRAAGSALINSERLGALGGALVMGLIDKQGTALPTVPFLGRAGTVGVALWFASKHFRSPSMNHAATGMLSIAAYELARDGKIAGDDSVVGVDTV